MKKCNYCGSSQDLVTSHICRRCQLALRKKHGMEYLNAYDKEALLK